MNGFDLLLLAILTSVGGALLLLKGSGHAAGAALSLGRRPAGEQTDPSTCETVRQAHTAAGVRWLVVSGLAFLLAVTRERDTIFLVVEWDRVLMPCVVLAAAWVITSARADRAACQGARTDATGRAGVPLESGLPEQKESDRHAALKRAYTIKRADRRPNPAPADPDRSSLSHIMQCPEATFWRDF